MSHHFVFEKELKPIPRPWPEEQATDDALRAWGFGDPDRGIMFGNPHGMHMTIVGPGDNPNYEWACFWTVNGRCFAVWCRTFAELHAYLNDGAARLLSVMCAG